MSVTLYAYSLYGSSQSIKSKKSTSESFLWHVSLFVFGREITYSDEGVEIIYGGGNPKETVVMGTTSVNENELFTYVKYLERNWNKDTYHFLNRNCIQFATDLLNFLGIKKKIPHKYTEKCAATSIIGTVALCGFSGFGIAGIPGALVGAAMGAIGIIRQIPSLSSRSSSRADSN